MKVHHTRDEGAVNKTTLRPVLSELDRRRARMFIFDEKDFAEILEPAWKFLPFQGVFGSAHEYGDFFFESSDWVKFKKGKKERQVPTSTSFVRFF